MKTNYIWWCVSGIAVIAVCFACVFLVQRKSAELLVEEVLKPDTKVKQEKTITKDIPSVKDDAKIKYNLYSDTDMPLTSIVEISKLPEKVKKIVDEVLESSQGIYLLKANKDKVFIITQNANSIENRFFRNNVELVEVSLKPEDNYKKTVKTIGYTGENNELENAVNGFDTQNDIWEYDKSQEIPRPTKHVKYDNNGKVEFTEVWNYDNSPIKYEMKNANDKVVSVLKETTENGENYTREQLFYDDNGHTEMNISAHYSGANISRFTYFNAKQPTDNVSIMSEYTDSVKTVEKVYNSDYELIETLQSKYDNNDKRTDIKVYDKDGNAVADISS
ncbi:MAG: hypothetical protein MJ231_01855 [bacterium]|nr:hypothetical protein [bacterium]